MADDRVLMSRVQSYMHENVIEKPVACLLKTILKRNKRRKNT